MQKKNNRSNNKKGKKTTTIIKDTNNNSKKATKLTKREIINRHGQHIAPESVHGQPRTSCTPKIEEVLITIPKHLMRNIKYTTNIKYTHCTSEICIQFFRSF